MRNRVIKELGEGKPQMDEPKPVQIAEDNALPGFLLGGFDQLHLFLKIAPALAIVDHAIDPGPELRIERGPEFLLPPKIEWKIESSCAKTMFGR